MHLLKKFFSSFNKITFKNPKKTKILIYDYTGSEVLIESMLYGLEYSIFPARLEFFYISPKILFRMAKKLFVFDFQYLKEIKSYVYKAYLLSCVEYINPKIVITYIDNDITFQWLSKKYNNAEFYAIQNGTRTKSGLTELDSKGFIRKFSMPHFVCFGQNDVDNYRKFGHKIDDPVCLGSLRAGYYPVINKIPTRIIFDICIISEYAEHNGTINDQIFLGMMNMYIKKNNKSVVIALRNWVSIWANEEYEFFFKIFGEKVTIIRQNENDRHSTYNAMAASNVIIANYSTAALEAFGWGKKVLLCNIGDIYGLTVYEIFNQNLFSIKSMDYNIFEKKLNKLLDMDQNEFVELTKELRKYTMNYNPELPVHVYMRNIIENLIRDVD